ncbi:MAG: hypothetical protein HY286_01405 [Planctomycetes bacterium]|nr:hypothetical protein [Planctomycetota bacterium]
MKTHSLLLGTVVFAAGLLGGQASAQKVSVGGRMPEFEISDLAQTGAKSVGEFAGRAVLVEFFAYW